MCLAWFPPNLIRSYLVNNHRYLAVQLLLHGDIPKQTHLTSRGKEEWIEPLAELAHCIYRAPLSNTFTSPVDSHRPLSHSQLRAFPIAHSGQ